MALFELGGFIRKSHQQRLMTFQKRFRWLFSYNCLKLEIFPKGAKLARRGIREEGEKEKGKVDEGGRPGKQMDRRVRNAADNRMKAN